MTRSTWFRPHPVAQRLASDEEVRNLALEVFGALPRMLRYGVEGFLQGVFSGRQPLEDHTSALYRGYEPVRRLLRAKYGPHVRLYRGEPTTIPEERREFLSWAPSQKMAARFAEQREFSIVEADVSVDDVVAVLAPTRSYVEYLVLDQPEYHVQRAALPMLGFVYFDIPREGSLKQQAAAATRSLRREVQAVGGRVLRVKIDELDRKSTRLNSSH
jgi:hypothetical protein